VEPERNPSKAGRSFLRRIFRRPAAPSTVPSREAVVIAVASGKGGTGKSFFATNAAIALHRQGLRVVLVDCDFGLANAHLLLGCNPRYQLQHLFAGQVSPGRLLTRTVHGPMLVAGGSGVASLAELEVAHMHLLAGAVQEWAAAHDVLLLDCAAGLSPQALVTMLAARHAVLVTNPEIAALTDAYALIKCLARQPQCPQLHVIINRVTQPGVGPQTFSRLAEVSLRFAASAIHYLGELPEDPGVTQRRLGQPPMIVGLPSCATSKAILSCLERLAEQVGGFQQVPVLEQGVADRMAAQLRRW
jgi:flagellar biosynthesis protein FlhG